MNAETLSRYQTQYSLRASLINKLSRIKKKDLDGYQSEIMFLCD